MKKTNDCDLTEFFKNKYLSLQGKTLLDTI